MENELKKERNTIKKNPYLWIAISVLIIIAGSFYWFQYRPSKARKECSSVIANEKAEAQRLYDSEGCNQSKPGWKTLGSDEYKLSVKCSGYKDKMTNSSKIYDDDFKTCMREKGVSN